MAEEMTRLPHSERFSFEDFLDFGIFNAPVTKAMEAAVEATIAERPPTAWLPYAWAPGSDGLSGEPTDPLTIYVTLPAFSESDVTGPAWSMPLKDMVADALQGWTDDCIEFSWEKDKLIPDHKSRALILANALRALADDVAVVVDRS